MAIFANGFRIPNQFDMIGAAAMIGMALAPMAIGRTDSRTRAQRETANAVSTPAVTPITSPPRASYRVAAAAVCRTGHSAMNAAAIADGTGRMKFWRWSCGTPSSQMAMTPRKTTIAGAWPRTWRAIERPASGAAHLRTRDRRRRSPDRAFGQRATGGGDATPAAERLADLGDQLEVARGLARVVGPWARQVDVDHPNDSAQAAATSPPPSTTGRPPRGSSA